MKHHEMTAENTEFVILSFEGPDRYSMAGGLGVRVDSLSQALANMGFFIHLFFIGDPGLPGEEYRCNERLLLHRWGQWISNYHPAGVYQGEYEKLNDFNSSVPGFIVNNIVRRAVEHNRMVVILAEEWHTTEAVCRIHELLIKSGMRENVVMFWNVNNTFGFQHIDWSRLASSATITTVSRYMRQILSGMGIRSFVIPNGIPNSLLEPIDEKPVNRLKEILNSDLILTKVARWDADKQWIMAVEAAARLKETGLRTVFIARGGIEPYGGEVMKRAADLGMTVNHAVLSGESIDDYLNMIENNTGADIINIKSHCTQEFLRILYRASTAVLANSSHEPFGLVGLETMAAGGIAFTGGTGEDYVVPFNNAVVLETTDPREIEGYVMYLEAYPALRENMRIAARDTSARFVWEKVIKTLVQKLEYKARIQGLMSIPVKPVYVSPRLPERQYSGITNTKSIGYKSTIAA